MKKCNVCQQTYTDDSLNFCLNDGGLLEKIGDDAPPTVFMNQARVTSPTNWTNAEPPARWQNPQMQSNAPFNNPPALAVQSQTLPTVSLVLGIFSILLICCYLGIPLGVGGLITGYLGLSNSNKDPNHYGGRSLAIGGMITSGIGLAISLLLLLLILLGNIK